MGLLSDGATPTRRRGGDGMKFIKLYFETFDDEDRALIRKWDADPSFPMSEIHRRVNEHHDIGYASVGRGLWKLRAAGWES